MPDVDAAPAVTIGRSLPAPTGQEVLDLLHTAEVVDGVGSVSEHALLQVKHGAPPGAAHVLARDATGALVGYANLDATDPDARAVAELVVHPEHRRRGVGTALLAHLDQEVGPRLRVWAHGELPGAAGLAARLGARAERTLLLLGRSLASPPLADPVLPPGIRIATFRPGTDDAAWVALNARAFAAHPEQGRLTVEDLRQRTAEPWFDPAGLFLAWRAGAGKDQLAGSHWTKVHPATAAQPARGEVYVLGIAPEEQGEGLGRALTLVGLHHLRAQRSEGRSLGEVFLYVDADNEAAVRTYERLGFTRWSADVLYGR